MLTELRFAHVAAKPGNCEDDAATCRTGDLRQAFRHSSRRPCSRSKGPGGGRKAQVPVHGGERSPSARVRERHYKS